MFPVYVFGKHALSRQLIETENEIAQRHDGANRGIKKGVYIGETNGEKQTGKMKHILSLKHPTMT